MYKIAVVSDIHYYSETLGVSGPAFDIRYNGDQRCLRESGAITQAAFDKISSSDCDSVIIAGDMSNDGEKVSHDEFIEKLKVLDEKKPTNVIFATHDWCCDGNARKFVGEFDITGIPTYNPEELRQLYKPYGENRAYSTHINEIGACSYAIKLNDKITFIGLNDDKDGKGRAGYDDDHLKWILDTVREAKSEGRTVILAEHHLVLPTVTTLVTKGMLIGDHEEKAEMLAEAGVDILIVGHSHFQRTQVYTAKNGNKMTQINVGSLTGYPAPILWLTFEDKKCKADVEFLEKFNYNGVELSQDFLRDHLDGLIRKMFEAARDDEKAFIKILSGYGLPDSTCQIIYTLLHPFANRLINLTVGQAAKLINALTFWNGGTIDKYNYEKIYNENLLNKIIDVFMGIFDGLPKSKGVTDPVYVISMNVVDAVPKLLKNTPIKKEKKKNLEDAIEEIKGLVKELLIPSEPDNIHSEILLK